MTFYKNTLFSDKQTNFGRSGASLDNDVKQRKFPNSA